MPRFSIFGRRWAISSDDFVVPEITEGLIRFIWFVISFFVYITRAKSDVCSNLHLYMIVSLVENSLVMILCFATAFVSSLGTIVNGLPRRHLRILLYLRCPLILFEIVWNILGSVWLHGSPIASCDSTFTVGVAVTIVGGWIMLFILVIGIIVNFDPTGTIHSGDIDLADEARKLWRTRIKMFFICASRSDKAKLAFEDVAQLFVDLFSDSDLVWTDVWAAMLLLTNKEMRVLNERARRSVSSDAPDWMTIQSASRIMEFSLGVYGWPYYMVGRSCSPKALWKLAKRGRCCGFGCGCDSALIIKDNCCMCNTAALMLQTGIQETDLFYVNLHNEIWETPFVACFDHATKSIVIAIRGSLSMRDAITDLTAAEETLELNSCPPYVETAALIKKQSVFSNPGETPNMANGELPSPECIKCRVHRGMLSSARYVASILDNERILDDMFVLQPDYNLVFTGHSLGAGVACLLGIIFKPRYPSLKCYAFSPPGCVISQEGIEFTKSFVYSIVFGDDLVVRLSFESVRTLKQNVMDVLQNCDRPKYEIMLKGCYKLLCGTSGVGRVDSNGALSSSRTASPIPSADRIAETPSEPATASTTTDSERKTLVQIDDDLDYSPLLSPQRRTARSYTDETNASTTNGRVQLFCPGRIMHFQLRNPANADSHEPAYISRWVHHSHFSNVRISNSMIMDHMPWVLSNVLKSYIRMNQYEDELIQFLSRGNRVARLEALKILRSLLAHENCSLQILMKNDFELTKILCKICLESKSNEETQFAVDCLVNATSNSELVSNCLLNNHFPIVEFSLTRLNEIAKPGNDTPQLVKSSSMLLSNLTRQSEQCKKIWQKLIPNDKSDDSTSHHGSDLSGIWRSLELICANLHNADKRLDYCMFVIRNFSQLKEFRDYLLAKPDCDSSRKGPRFKALLPLTNLSVSDKRREAAIDVIRNCCFDYNQHTELVSIGDDLIFSLLNSIIGPEELSESENESLPIDLQYMTPDKVREPIAAIRIKILEALYQLCSTKIGREFLRNRGAYYVLREYHKWEKNEEADNLLFNVVNVLIRTEGEIGYENLHDLDTSLLTEKEIAQV